VYSIIHMITACVGI